MHGYTDKQDAMLSPLHCTVSGLFRGSFSRSALASHHHASCTGCASSSWATQTFPHLPPRLILLPLPPPVLSPCLQPTERQALRDPTITLPPYFKPPRANMRRSRGNLWTPIPLPRSSTAVRVPRPSRAYFERKRYERLMTFVDPMVHILFTFSATLGEGIGLVNHLIRPISYV